MTDLNLVLDDAIKRIKAGNLFVSENDFDTSFALFQSAIDLEPENLSALCNGAYTLMKQKHMARASHWISQAMGIDPENAHVLGINALIAQETTEFGLARTLFEHSIRNDPNNATRLLNYAYMLQLVGDHQRASEMYTRARNINVLDVSTRFQRALTLLTLAKTYDQWREALDEYEIRQLIYPTPRPEGKIMYTGEDVTHVNPVLLLVAEQGVGDAVMTARYARYLKTSGAFNRIYMLCQEPWVKLLDRVIGIDGVFSDLSKVPEYTHYIPTMSLMRSENYPAIPVSNIPYLRRALVSGINQHIRIGLCWQGNPQHGNDRWRSIGPDLFCDPFAELSARVEFVSLHTPEVNRYKPDFVKDYQITTLDKLADVIAGLDLVVTVDTAQLHIAGAMGVPAYGLIACGPDWRWGTSGETTGWYPSVTLFRAAEPLAWLPVLARVRERVEKFIEERRSTVA